eukprot:m.92542 g.92542  ORF g.92542 m.92542 type:complete len:203 (-) comp8513_c1_seq1:353-961(-)
MAVLALRLAVLAALASLSICDDYSVSMSFPKSASSASIPVILNPSLVSSASTDSFAIPSSGVRILTAQLSSIVTDPNSVNGFQYTTDENGDLSLDFTLTDLNNDPTTTLNNLGNITLPVFNGNITSSPNITVVTRKNTNDDVTIILAVIFSILGAVVLVAVFVWVYLNHKRKIVLVTTMVAIVNSPHGTSMIAMVEESTPRY